MHERSAFWLDMCLTPRPRGASGYFEGSGQRQYAPIGEVLLVPPGRRMRTFSAEGEQKSILCHLHEKELGRWLDDDFEWTDSRLNGAIHVSNDRVRVLLRALVEEIRAPGLGSKAMAELLTAQLVLELARHYSDLIDQPRFGGLSPAQLRRIDDRLAFLEDPPSLSDIALLCGISVRQLTRGFRASRGISIGQHIARIRTNQAIDLLASGASVKTAAFALGFSSPSSFAYAFRRETGKNPTAHRQSLKHRLMS